MMFPLSRYKYCLVYTDDSDRQYLDEREPFRFTDEADNRFHPVTDGDTLWGLAHRYFPGFKRRAGLWWVIAEFQPTPIVDPTIRLKPGEVIVIPSERIVRTKLFSEDRRRFH